MGNTITLNALRELVGKILQRHKSNNFSQCSKCGSTNLDLRELAITLDGFKDESFSSEDEVLIEAGEQCGDLFREIVDIGFPEDCIRNQDYDKWFQKNEYRYSQKLSDNYDDAIFFKPFQDVVIKTDDKCGCFKNPS
jgi:hypothetical protein